MSWFFFLFWPFRSIHHQWDDWLESFEVFFLNIFAMEDMARFVVERWCESDLVYPVLEVGVRKSIRERAKNNWWTCSLFLNCPIFCIYFGVCINIFLYAWFMYIIIEPIRYSVVHRETHCGMNFYSRFLIIIVFNDKFHFEKNKWFKQQIDTLVYRTYL